MGQAADPRLLLRDSGRSADSQAGDTRGGLYARIRPSVEPIIFREKVKDGRRRHGKRNKQEDQSEVRGELSKLRRACVTRLLYVKCRRRFRISNDRQVRLLQCYTRHKSRMR